MEGFVPLWRDIRKWKWANDPITLHVYIHLLARASHNDYSFKGVILKPGQVPIGREEFSESIGITVGKLRTALKRLKSTNEIKIDTTTKGTVITIVGWSNRQLKKKEVTNEHPTDNQRTSNEHPTDNQRTSTTNNYKIKNNNKVKKKP